MPHLIIEFDPSMAAVMVHSGRRLKAKADRVAVMQKLADRIIRGMRPQLPAWTFDTRQFTSPTGHHFFNCVCPDATPDEQQQADTVMDSVCPQVLTSIHEYMEVVSRLTNDRLAFAFRLSQVPLRTWYEAVVTFDAMMVIASQIEDFSNVSIVVTQGVQGRPPAVGPLREGSVLHSLHVLLPLQGLSAYLVAHEVAHLLEEHRHVVEGGGHTDEFVHELSGYIDRLSRQSIVGQVRRSLSAGPASHWCGSSDCPGRSGAGEFRAERWVATVWPDDRFTAFWCECGADMWGMGTPNPDEVMAYVREWEAGKIKPSFYDD